MDGRRLRTPPPAIQSQTRHIHVTPDRGVFDSNNWGDDRVSLNQADDLSQRCDESITPDRGVFDSNNWVTFDTIARGVAPSGGDRASVVTRPGVA
jgi:hypothetical protein